MDKTKEERAKAFADRHQMAEFELRGLGATYGYQRIYNAERGAYERGATEQKAIDDAHLAEVVAHWKIEELAYIELEKKFKGMIKKARKILEEKTNGGLSKIFLDEFEELMMEE